METMKAVSVQQQQQPVERTTDDGSTSSSPTIKGLHCQQGDDSQCADTSPLVELPEDILHHIHGLMLWRDAACAASVSRAFLRSWRCYPKLILHVGTLRLNANASKDAFVSRVDNILQNHSGRGLKIFKLSTYPCLNLHPGHIDRWLQVAIAPGIQEFALQINQRDETEYNFPCSLLSSERGRSIQSIFIEHCSLHSVAQVDSMSCLTSLSLSLVRITGEELCSFLSNSCSLEELRLMDCNEIICLKIPGMLSQLNRLSVMWCKMLEMIDSNAPNLSKFYYEGPRIPISFGASFPVRRAQMYFRNERDMLSYASTSLPSIVPNIETLLLETEYETVNTPIVSGRFAQLKFLEIKFSATGHSQGYDFYSLISFLDASPTLETFILRIMRMEVRLDSVLDDPNGDPLRSGHLSGQRHGKLRSVIITGFCSSKSMIELTRHIIQKSPSLGCITLDTTFGYDREFIELGKCWSMSKEALIEAEKACVAVKRYVEGCVPSTVTLQVIEPCKKCHINEF